MEFSSYSYIDILISGVLALIMFGIGLSLTPLSFKNIFVYPKSILIGLSSQMIALPLITFCAVYFADISLPLKVGFIILAACPGGTTSGFITYFFKGNVALSISLTAVNSFLTLLSIPFIVNIALYYFLVSKTEIRLPFLETVLQIFSVAIVPAALGVWVRVKKESFALNIQKPLKIILIFLLAIVFLIKFFAGEKQGGTGITTDEIMKIIPYALLINILGFAYGMFSGLLPKLGTKTSFTIGIEVAMQNTTLAFLVAGTLLQNQDMVKPSLIYSMFSFWTAILYGLIVKYLHKVKSFDEFKS